MLGTWHFKCQQCGHTDSMRGEEFDVPNWLPNCTEPTCRFGRGNPTAGMVVTNFTLDEPSHLQ